MAGRWLVALLIAGLLWPPSAAARGSPSAAPLPSRKVERLARQIAGQGWTRARADRLIALLEEDGRVTRGERDSLAGLLQRRGFADQPSGRGADNFVGQTRARLRRYLAVVDAVGAPAAGHARRPADGELIKPGQDIDAARYRRNVEVLSGMRSTLVADAGGVRRRVTFRDRFLPSPANQLGDVLQWLAARYAELGLRAERQPVRWHGKTFYNLVVTIPGASREAIVLCDHYDVADKEPIAERNKLQLRRDHRLGEREIDARFGTVAVGQAVPGADDNASATAALLEAAHLLRAQLAGGARLARTIKLVHLVGEELPTSDLGARWYVARAKARGEKIGGVIVLDMIGVDRTGRRKMQIAPGRPDASLDIAGRVKQAVADLGLDLKPVLRPYGARKSFLVQTDGIIFSRAGFPVVLLNEHLNNDRDHFRTGYHDEFDIPRLMSFDFATNVTRAACETLYRLAAAPASGAPHRAAPR